MNSGASLDTREFSVHWCHDRSKVKGTENIYNRWVVRNYITTKNCLIRPYFVDGILCRIDEQSVAYDFDL